MCRRSNRGPRRPSVQVEAKGLHLVVEAAGDLPTILTDRDQIERVIVNLVTNATRATPTGGSITITAGRRDGEIAFSVGDTGAGIPREYLPRVFEPFVQVPSAPAGGAGLGLSGRGSTFTFTVPIGEEQLAETRA